MAIVNPTGYLIAAFQFTVSGDAEDVLTTCGFSVEDLSEDATDAATMLAAAFNAVFTPTEINTGWAFKGVRVAMGHDGGPGPIAEVVATTTGSRAGGSLPQNCAGLLRKASAVGGRANRGRMYLPPCFFREGDVDNVGVIAEPFRSDVSNGWSSVLFTFHPVILHDETSPTTLPTEMTSVSLDSVIATQRRRLR